jgi:ParB-like chromosome segregation protein Spo0J
MTLQLRLDQLTNNVRAWPRAHADFDRVAEFKELYEAGGLTALPPVLVIERADDFLIADGWHRCQALFELGLDEVLVEVAPSNGRDPITEAFEIGLRSSATASIPLTRTEKQAAVQRLTVEGGRTDQEIAELVGVARTTVGRLRASDSALHVGPAVTRTRRRTAPDEAAVRLFRAIEAVWESRGLGIGDAVFGDRTGARLAKALRIAHGDEASEQARRYRTWIDAAIDELGGQAD